MAFEEDFDFIVSIMNIAKEEDEIKPTGIQPEVIPIAVTEAPEQLKEDGSNVASESKKQPKDDKDGGTSKSLKEGDDKEASKAHRQLKNVKGGETSKDLKEDDGSVASGSQQQSKDDKSGETSGQLKEDDDKEAPKTQQQPKEGDKDGETSIDPKKEQQLEEDDEESGTSQDSFEDDDGSSENREHLNEDETETSEDEGQHDDGEGSETFAATKQPDAVDGQSGESGVYKHQLPHPPAQASPSKIAANQTFAETFDEFFKTFLATESSKLDDREIRGFTQKIPRGFVVPEDRFKTMFDVLFKIKEIPNKAVYNDSLALLKECFVNLDFNKFLVQFWNCDTFKDRELGPIGWTLSANSAKYDFSGVQPNNNEITLINAKATDTAWSMLLDVEATVTSMLNTYMNDKPMSVFYLIILRRFKCLGDYKLKLDGKEAPMFLYFLRKLINGLDGHNLNIALSCLVSVCWSPKGHYCYSALKPSYALREIMNHLVCEDQHHSSYMLALRRLFTPITGFGCRIEWDEESKDFDNPSLFLLHFIKYYNRKQSIAVNDDVFLIIRCFAESLKYSGKKITNLGAFEEIGEVDWTFAYRILGFLGVEGVKRHIPESLYKALPEAEVDKYIPLDEADPSLEKALTALTELYLLSNVNQQSLLIPDTLYKNLWNTHAHPKSIIDLFARSILQAYKNLKNCVKIEIDRRFVDFVSRISQFCLNYDLLEAFSCTTELNFDLISRCTHLVIIGRTLRLMIENEYNKDKRRFAFRDLPDFFFDLFKIFSMKTRDKFADIRTINQGLWPPWRKGAAGCMDDEKAMAINHFLNSIQKEAFCMFDCTFGHGQEFLDFLLFLHKQRKYHGISHPKVEEALRANFSGYFEHIESGNADRGQRHESGQMESRSQQENRPQQPQQNRDRGGAMNSRRDGGSPMNNGHQDFRHQNADQNRHRAPMNNGSPQPLHGEQSRPRNSQGGGRGGRDGFGIHPQFNNAPPAPRSFTSSNRLSRGGGRGGSSAA